MKSIFLILISGIALVSCAQDKPGKQNNHQPVYKNVGGPCEGCEAIHETPVPFDRLNWVDTLPDFGDKGPTLEVSGMVYQQDGKTPAPNVILYVYHTDQTGHYPKRGDETGWGKRHGYIRGWIKTDAEGRYKFYTLKPAAYPTGNIPAHIHITVKEPDKNEYWIDDFLFDDDPLLTPEERSRSNNRGGSGIVRLQSKNGMFVATRNIVLGENIPDYPMR